MWINLGVFVKSLIRIPLAHPVGEWKFMYYRIMRMRPTLGMTPGVSFEIRYPLGQ